MRKLKLLEHDLDTAEDKVAETTAEKKDLEVREEELTRENKQLQHRINTLEGKSGPSASVPYSNGTYSDTTIDIIDDYLSSNHDNDRCRE